MKRRSGRLLQPKVSAAVSLQGVPLSSLYYLFLRCLQVREGDRCGQASPEQRCGGMRP